MSVSDPNRDRESGRPLCLGLVVYGALAQRSGGYLYDRQLVEHLRAAGDRVEVISLRPRPYGQCLLDNLLPGLPARLAARRYDALLEDELNHPSLWWLNRRLRAVGVGPIISIVHHLRGSEQRPAWQNRLYRAVERAYLGSVDALIVNTETTRQAVAALGAAEKPGVVAYPAADHLGPGLSAAAVAARVHGGGPLRLLCIGNVAPRKGLHVLLDALARLAGREPALAWRLDVAGSLRADPAYAASIRAQIGRYGLGARVYLHDAVDQARLRELLATSDMLVMPSSYEGFGIAALEGMAFGLPVVAGAAGGLRELVRDGESGRLVPPADAGAIADVLTRLAHDHAYRLALSLGALRRAQAHPTWAESMAEARAFVWRVAGWESARPGAARAAKAARR